MMLAWCRKATILCGAIVGLLTLTGCPANYQHYTAAPSESGNTAYSVDGYTSPGELKKSDAMKYAENFAKGMCVDGGTVKRLDTLPSRSGWSDILYWQAVVECNSNRQPPSVK